jgi:Holliday junction resolvase RusA-like endonuclease
MHDDQPATQAETAVCAATTDNMVNAAPQSWTIWLPFPLSSNNLHAHRIVPGRGGRGAFAYRYPTSAYRRWRREAEVRIMAARIPRMVEPVDLEIELRPPNARTRDASNFTKGIEDALVAARVLPDDSWRWVRSVRPFWADAPPSRSTSGAVVTIRVAQLGGIFSHVSEPTA